MRKYIQAGRPFIILLFLTLFIRLISLGVYPLMDTTEARYAEIARIMAHSGDWVTPYFDIGVPFWGKPPLHTWFSAIGFNVLGINEFAARFPHFLAGLGALAFIGYLAGKRYEEETVLVVLTVLATSAVFMVSMGAVMTDTLLMLSTTFSLGSAWLALSTGEKKAGYGFFIGLALGMLAKGPVAVVLVGIALFLWCATGNQWKVLFRKLPWLKGTALSLMLTAPWYVTAELKTPGFLDYFFIGEHFNRFVLPGWSGDLYGAAHAETRGTIWVYALLSGFPWSLCLIFLLGRRLIRGEEQTVEPSQRQWRRFLWCWLLAAPLLFTPAANILPTYVLPAMPALAFLIVEYAPPKSGRPVLVTATLTPVLVCVSVILLASGRIEPKSDKDLLQALDRDAASMPLIYWGKRPFSARFYSRGAAIGVESAGELTSHLGDQGLVVLSKDNALPEDVTDNYSCQPIGENARRRMVMCTKEKLLSRHAKERSP